MRLSNSSVRWLVCAFVSGNIWLAAQTGPSTSELQRETQNPVADLISVPFQNNLNFPIGAFGRAQNVMNVEPVVPLSLNEHWNLITRWITPVVYQPDVFAESGAFAGLGDLNPSFFVSPAGPHRIIWGFGPTVLAPSATNRELGQGKWGAGPSVVVLTQPGPWTLGFLANNIWSFAGQSDREAVNQGYLQYFVNYNMSDGWYVGSQPILTADWKENGPNRWTIPFGFALGRITRLGRLPVNAQAGFYYNAVRPRDLPYPKWQVRLQLALLFPKAR